MPNTAESKLDLILDNIRKERERQCSLPGSEYDFENSINDWIAIATHYLSEAAKRKSSKSYSRGVKTSKDDYEKSLTKAAAVIVAALEFSDVLQRRGDIS